MATETSAGRGATARRSLAGPIIFLIFGLTLLLGLGTWQVQRLHWKEGLIAERTAAVSAPPVALPTTLDAARGMEYRRVRAVGRFLYDREALLYAQSEGGDSGYHAIVPLVLASGGTLFVDRGYVPDTKKDRATRQAGDPAGEIAVTGLVRLPAGKPSSFTPDNHPEKNEWYWLDLPAMAAAAHVTDALPFTIDADAAPNPGGYPQGGQTPLDLPNNHLQYAITWYALAAALVIVYIAWMRRRGAAT